MINNKICGIYKITSPINKIYIGSSRDINSRIQYHKYSIQKYTPNVLISKSYMEYGFENHKIEVIEECEVSFLLERERYWQEHYKCFSDKGLNINKAANSNFIDGKRKRNKDKLSKNFINGKPIFLNLESGIFYVGYDDLLFVYRDQNKTTLRLRLFGHIKNNTKLIVSRNCI